MSNEQQSVKMWSGRFREPLDREFEKWQRSIVFDWRLLTQEIAASKAHASALCSRRYPDRERNDASCARRWMQSPRDHSSDAGKAQVRDHPTAEDIHHFVELTLAERIGSLGLKLHTGRSRNEQIATDLRLYVRDADRARQSKHWPRGPSAGRAGARGRRRRDAQLYASAARRARAGGALAAGLCRDDPARCCRACSDCAARLNYCPLGSGAVAGATLALDRTIAARELGFTAPTANSAWTPPAIATSFSSICRRSPSSACTSAGLPKRSLCLRRRSLDS